MTEISNFVVIRVEVVLGMSNIVNLFIDHTQNIQIRDFAFWLILNISRILENWNILKSGFEKDDELQGQIGLNALI